MLSHNANIIGISTSANIAIKCFIFNWIFIPRAVGMGNYMEHVLLDVKNLSIDKP